LKKPVPCCFDLPTQIRKHYHPIRIVWSGLSPKFNTVYAEKLDGLGYIADASSPRYVVDLQPTSIVDDSQERMSRVVKNITAVAIVLAQVAEDHYCR
jgi:hypothetical protein